MTRESKSFEFGSEKPKETSKGLPVISKTTIEAIEHSHEASEDWTTHLYAVKRRLIKENPELAKYVRSQVVQSHPAMAEMVLNAIVGTLAVLEHQAEANKLSASFKPPEPFSKK